eukprot:1127727-Rhodomonas_salina.1
MSAHRVVRATTMRCVSTAHGVREHEGVGISTSLARIPPFPETIPPVAKMPSPARIPSPGSVGSESVPDIA